tara:strand:- start:846 stop:1301 length:456 start_codon:yes stop_codon:yes gene_type:complete
MIIYIDLDGVLADFQKAASQHPDYGTKGFRPDLTLDFSKFDIIPGAKDAVKQILDMGHDVYIASTAPWDNPNAWTQKREWVGKNFPELKRKVFLTHHKNLLKGDILIDDSTYRGQTEFEGEFMKFDPSIGYDWDFMVKSIDNMTKLLKIIC